MVYPYLSGPRRRNRRRIWMLLLATAAVIPLLRYWPRGPEPLPQDPYVQVFFNHAPGQRYREPYREQRRPGYDLEQLLIDEISRARVSVDVAVQELNLPRVAQALIRQAEAGVAVRVILENSYSQPWSQQRPGNLDSHRRSKFEDLWAFSDLDHSGSVDAAEASRRDAVLMLQQAGIPLLDDTADGSKGSGLMHHKFIVVDGQRLVTGSANFTLSGIHGDWLNPESRGNANVLLRILSSELARAYQAEFELLWGDGPGGAPDSRFGIAKPLRPAVAVSLPGSQLQAQFSPHRRAIPWGQTTGGLITQTLGQARRSVDLALFVFSEQAIADRLGELPGVRVRALVDRSFIYRSYSEALDLLGVALPDRRCRYEDNNRPWATPALEVGYPQLAQGDKLHHKFALIDEHTVIVGSHNWSSAASHTNDENLLVITNPTVARHFRQEFERLRDLAQTGHTELLSQKLGRGCSP